MKKVFLDTNIILDILEKRKDFKVAANILDLAANGEIRLFASPLSFINCIYVARKSLGYAESVRNIRLLRELIMVSPMTEVELDRALSATGIDVEDLLQYNSAITAQCECIVTRDLKHFPKDGIPVLSPYEFLESI